MCRIGFPPRGKFLYVEVLTSLSQNVTVFGNKAFKEGLSL